MTPSTQAALTQPFSAVDLVGIVFGLFALVYGLLWRRARDPGMAWFTASWVLIAGWFFGSRQMLYGDLIAWSPVWYLTFAAFVALTVGLIGYLQVPVVLRRRALFWMSLPLCVLLAVYHLPLLGFEVRRSMANLPAGVWYGTLGALAWWAGGREPGAGHRLVAVILWTIPPIGIGLAYAGIDAPVLRIYGAIPFMLLALTLLTATLLRRQQSLEAEVARRAEAEAELQRSHDVLTRSAALLDRTGEVAQVGGWAVDLPTLKLSWTRETFRIAEVEPPNEPPLASGIDLFAPEARPVISAAVQATMETGAPYDLELPLITAKGRQRWVRTQGFAEFLDGKVVRIYGTFQDITERRIAEAERQEAQHQLQLESARAQQYLQVAQAILLVLDEDGHVALLNPKGHEVLGYAEGELHRKDWFRVCVPPEEHDHSAQLFRQTLAGTLAPIEYHESPVVTRSGERRMIAWHNALLFDGDGRIRGTLSSGEDITARRQAEQALLGLNASLEERLQERERALAEAEAARDRFSRVFESAATVSSISEVADGTIIAINESGCLRYGLRREEIIGRTLQSMGVGMAPESRRTLIEALERDGRVINMEIVFHVKQGPAPTLLVCGEYIEWEGRRRLLLIGNDITERRHAEQALRDLNASLEARVDERTRELQALLEHLRQAQDELVRAEKMASLGALVAGVAHELNTPIGNAVLVASTLDGRQREFEAAIAGGLRRSALDAFLAGLREGSVVVERNLQRAAELIGSFKQIAVDQSSYQRREFELADVVQEIALAISPTLKRSGVRLLDQVPTGLRLDSHPGPLGQVLINLVNNAATHAFQEGQPGSVRIAAEATGKGQVRLTVSDDGRGIPQQDLKRIFDPFFTTRLGQGGSGLGLHITYTLVTGLLGGRIEVRSEPGQGAAFIIELPCVAPQGGAQDDRA